MLVLSRKSHESVVVGGSGGFDRMLKVIVLEIAGGKVKLGFDVDPSVPVHRSEVLERIRRTDGRRPPETVLWRLSGDELRARPALCQPSPNHLKRGYDHVTACSCLSCDRFDRIPARFRRHCRLFHRSGETSVHHLRHSRRVVLPGTRVQKAVFPRVTVSCRSNPRRMRNART